LYERRPEIDGGGGWATCGVRCDIDIAYRTIDVFKNSNYMLWGEGDEKADIGRVAAEVLS